MEIFTVHALQWTIVRRLAHDLDVDGRKLELDMFLGDNGRATERHAKCSMGNLSPQFSYYSISVDLLPVKQDATKPDTFPDFSFNRKKGLVRLWGV